MEGEGDEKMLNGQTRKKKEEEMVKQRPTIKLKTSLYS